MAGLCVVFCVIVVFDLFKFLDVVALDSLVGIDLGIYKALDNLVAILLCPSCVWSRLFTINTV